MIPRFFIFHSKIQRFFIFLYRDFFYNFRDTETLGSALQYYDTFNLPRPKFFSLSESHNPEIKIAVSSINQINFYHMVSEKTIELMSFSRRIMINWQPYLLECQIPWSQRFATDFKSSSHKHTREIVYRY